jgi:hypothetical protein
VGLEPIEWPLSSLQHGNSFAAAQTISTLRARAALIGYFHNRLGTGFRTAEETFDPLIFQSRLASFMKGVHVTILYT